MPSSNRDGSTDRTASRDVPATDGSVPTEVEAPLRVTAFWAAIVLPFGAVGLLATGLESNADWWLLAGLVLASVVSLYVGHPHREE
jgi:hypothetical protein